MVTSAVAGEGKSTTAANLAVAFARAGKRTILVDLDLRRPTVEVLFGAPRQPGVTDVIRGRSKIEDILVTIPVLGANRVRSNGRGPTEATLSVIPAGALPPNPGELIAGEGIPMLLLDLQRRAEIILIDAPPLLTVGDGLALSSQVDAIMVVTHLTRIRRPLLRELARVLDQSRARVLGFALAGAQRMESYYEYETYYRHGDEEALEDDVPREVRPQAHRSSSAGGSLR
jgi:capsular exopolysaccharide synthesis family protein